MRRQLVRRSNLTQNVEHISATRLVLSRDTGPDGV